MARRFLALAAVIGLFGQAQAANLLSKGDFEGDTTGWVFWNTKVPFKSSFHSTEAKHSGSYGAKIKVDSASPENNWWLQLKVPVDNITLKPNQTYQLTYWVKSTNQKELYGAFAVALDTTVYANLKPIADWTQGTITVKTGATVTKSLSILLSLGGDTGTYYFDDFVFETLVTAPPSANLFPNPGFETVDTAGWVLDRPDTTTRGVVTFNAAAMHSGTKGLQAIITKVDTADWGIRVYTPAFAATTGNTYTISFWAKSDSVRPVKIGFQPAGGGYISASPEQKITTTWTELSYSVTAASTASLQFTIFLGAKANVGTYSFDDLNLQETVPLTIPPLVFPAQGSWSSGIYRNLFVERGYKKDLVDAKVKKDFEQLFFGDSSLQAIYRTVGIDEAFIDGIDTSKDGNGNLTGADIRTEGMSYGMTIAVMMDRQDVFNKLWKFAKTRMQNTSGDARGYFAWRLSNVAPYTAYDKNPAPDGEEYFVSSLFLADKRWGSASGLGNILNYKQQADSLLTYMIMPRTGAIGPLVDPVAKQIVFSPAQASPYTDASYHIPAFYRMWAAFASHSNALWAEMADTSLAFWKRHMDATTGLNSDKAKFDGTPYSVTYYSYDAHRTPMYVGMDWAWFKADAWEVTQTKRNLGFFASKGAYVDNYNLDGSAPDGKATYAAGASQIGANGAAVLASDTIRDWRFVDDLWNSQPPTGNWRYYGGLVRMLGLLHVSGDFKAYGSPGLAGGISVHPRSNATTLLSVRLSGQNLFVSGVTGTVRLLDARGREAARTAVRGDASFALPHAGLWVVDAGSAGRRTVVLP